MKANKTTLWGIHAGRTGNADSLFLNGNYVATGWHEVGDLSSLAPEHYDQFDSRYKGLLPLRRVYVPEPIEVDEESPINAYFLRLRFSSRLLGFSLVNRHRCFITR